MTTPDLRRLGWKLEGGPYDGITVRPGSNPDPIIGLSIFPSRIEVLGFDGLATYRLEAGEDGQRAIVEGE
jgi:hypothetical protein